MTSRAAKRRAIADKLAADIDRLRKEIADRRAHMVQAKARSLGRPLIKAYTAPDGSWFAIWSRHVVPLARAVGALDRARRRLEPALDKAEHAARLAREDRERKARIAAANIGVMRRFDQMAADGAITERWAKERREEAKRIKTLQKKLAKRTTKDYTARPDWMQKPVKLPDPVQQPSFEVEEIKREPPPREGLIPGTYSLSDPDRIGQLLDRPRLPTVWKATYVGVRLIEAFRVLNKTPGTIWPKGFGAAWPAYKIEAGEAAIQAGAGTLAMGRNSIRVAPSSEAVARMNEAISWPMQFLSHRPGAAADVNNWADQAAWDQMDFDARSAPWVELQIIADALNAAREPIL